MTYLGLDVGSRRIGVSVGSSNTRIASPVSVIQRKSNARDAALIRNFAMEYDATGIVVGLPRELDGSIGAQAQSVLKFMTDISPLVGFPIEYYDERYSTAEALARRREAGLSEKRGRRTIDAAAASVILQDFLDSLDASNATGTGLAAKNDDGDVVD